MQTDSCYVQYVDDAEISAKLKLGGSYSELPGHALTVNQIVAWNLAHFRAAAGLTQEELGQRIGWSKAVVSAAERSWDGKRVRQFSADDLLTIATALGIPITAMFLPPEDDGIDVRYYLNVPVCTTSDGRVGHLTHTMHDLMLFVVPDAIAGPDDPDADDDPDNDSASDQKVAGQRYWDRYVAAINGYLGAEHVGELAEYIEDLSTEDRIVDHLARLRGQYEALRDMIADNDHLQAALVERLNVVRDQRTSISPHQAPRQMSGVSNARGRTAPAHEGHC